MKPQTWLYMSETFRGNHIKVLLEERHISIAKAARAIGVRRPYLSTVLNGHKQHLPRRIRDGLSEYLGVSRTWLETGGDTYYDEVVQIPLRGNVPALELADMGGRKISVPLSRLGSIDATHLFGLEVADNSLVADNVHRGDILICDPSPAQIPDGALCIVKVGGIISAKHVYREESQTRLLAGAVMTLHPAEDVEIIAKVVCSQRYQVFP